MNFFEIKLKLRSAENIKKKFYYSILGAVLNLFKNNTEVYNNILKINFRKNYNEYEIYIIIEGNSILNKMLNEFNLSNGNIISLDGLKFEITNISFSLINTKINKKNINNIRFKFYSPFFLKSKIGDKTINYYGIEPERIIGNLFSVLIKNIKYIDYIKTEKDKILFMEKVKELKLKIKDIFIIKEYNIRTEKVDVKDGIKSGIIGYIEYNIINKELFNDDFILLLNKATEIVNTIGMGNGKKLGLGNVKVFLK